MSDWLGLLFFILLIGGALVGLKVLANPKKKTEAEFERGAAESASLAGASMNALQKILDPAEARAEIARTELKKGHYDKKKREGKAEGNLSEEEND